MTQQDDTGFPNTTEPEITITVSRLIQGHPLLAQRRIDLLDFLTRRFPAALIETEINAMLREVSYDGRE